MRRISEDAARSFVARRKFNRSNTSITVDDDGRAVLSLHGNAIAAIHGGELYITLAGWNTTTTRERVNGILQTYYDSYKLQVGNDDFTPYFYYYGNQKMQVPQLYYPSRWGSRQPWVNTNDVINKCESFDPESIDEIFIPCFQLANDGISFDVKDSSLDKL